jgi:hypothetical protein
MELRTLFEGTAMRSTLRVLLGFALVAWVGVAGAAPPKEKDEATEVVTGTIRELTSDVDKYEDGRVSVKYTAVLKVDKVELTTLDSARRVVKEGDTLTIRWSHMTRRDGSTAGHKYSVHESDVVRVWLCRYCGMRPDFYPIENDKAFEKISDKKP